MKQVTIEQYREYLVSRQNELKQIIAMFEKTQNSSPDIARLYLEACADLDRIMERLFIIDNAEDLPEY